MKTKISTSVILGIFVLMFLASAVSAVIVLNPNTYTASIQQGSSGSFTFNITVDYPVTESNATFTTSSISNLTSGTNIIDSSNIVVGTLPLTLAAGTTSSNIAVTINIPSSSTLGTYTGAITIDAGREDPLDVNPNPQIIALTITVISSSTNIPTEITACNVTGDPNGNLEINKIKFSNDGISESNFGSDDEWYVLNDITVTIDIRNRGDEKIEDIEVNWGLWDKDANEWVIEPIDEDKFDLKSDKEETITISLNLENDLDIDLDELDDGDHYEFYVFANGFDNEIEDYVCASDSEPVSIIVESDFVVLDNMNFPELVSCGGNFQITADVWNIGDRDQDDVYVKIFNSELGINGRVDFNSIDAFDYENLDISINIPENAQEKTYYLRLDVYDEDDDIYESDSDESSFLVPIAVSGECTTSSSSGAKAVVSASMISGGKAGEDLVIKSTIFNSGTKSTTYTVNAAGYSDWASSVQLSENTFTLGTGESKDITITLKVKDDVSGEKSFNIEVVSGNQMVTTQPVTVSIESTSLWSKITGGSISGGNSLIWGIGILNVILIIVIVIVAIKVASK